MTRTLSLFALVAAFVVALAAPATEARAAAACVDVTINGAPTTVHPGVPFRVSGSIENCGRGTASFRWAWSVPRGRDQLILARGIVTLRPGQIAPTSAALTLPRGYPTGPTPLTLIGATRGDADRDVVRVNVR